MATPKRGSHAAKHNRAKNLMKGMTMAWADKNPMSEQAVIKAPVIGHRNPITRITIADLVAKFRKLIFEQMTMRWLVKMDLYFDYPDGARYIEERELEATCILKNLNEHCLAEHKAAMKLQNEKCYSFTKFVIECVGLS